MMRCLVLIALCVSLANANYQNKNRFHKLLNRYQQNRLGSWNQHQNQELFGSDDTDDYIDDYVDQIRRERMFDRDQCPRGFEDILGQEDEEYDNYDMEDNFRGRQYPEDMEEMTSRRQHHRRQYPTEDMEDMTSGRKHRQFRGRQYPTEDMEDMFQTEDMEGMRGRHQFRDEETEGMGFRHQYTGEDMEDTEGRQSWGDDDSKIRSPLLKEVRDANVKLASRLYEQCKQEKDDKNTVVSPISVQLALATLNVGARGNTRRQIGRVIGGNLKTQERKQIFKTLVRHLKGFRNMDYSTRQHSTKINTVTGLFVSQQTRAQQMFIHKVKGVMGATVKHCSFSQQPQQCRQTINQWVSQKTHGKINHIVPQDAITDNTKMILVNALELKATWGPQMRRHVTKEAKFYPLDTKKVKIVEVMETEGRFKYYEDELVKIVGVPTKQHELTMYTIVPKDKDGLTDVEKLHLQDTVQLKEVLNKVDRHTRRVHVQLPKFEIKHKVDVRRTLRKQGVTDAFDSKRADFSGITGVSNYEQDEMEETYGQSSFRRNPFLDIESGWGKFEQQGRHRRNPFMDTEMEGGMYGQMGKRETKLHLNKFIHQCTIKITENGITATTGSQTEESYEKYGRFNQGRMGGMEGGRFGDYESEEIGSFDEINGLGLRESSGKNVVKANRAFAFVVKHNPTQQLIMVGRVIDAAQKKVNHVPLTINNVDQL
jgi:serpin B